MRIFPLLFAAASVAACGSAEVANQATDLNRSSVAPVPSAPPAAQPAASSAAIPAAFQGVYDRDSAACAAPGEYRMEVRSDEIRFHESIGKVRKVTGLAPDRISVEADYQGEGERWTNVRELRLSDSAATIIVSGEGTTVTRRRCAGA
jgi:hypothetical protein